MGFLSAQDEQAVQKEFEKLTGPVTLTVFASELGSENNTQAVALIKEVGALSDKIAVKVLNPFIERDETAAYGISVTPAVAVEGSKDYGIRFLGVPAGYEFSNLIDSIIAVSRGEAQLKDESKTALAGLTRDVTIKVFATPT
jgi:alkyl hydroperoxide reductase subunit AhpF